jgi:hypothetical protein
LSSFSLFSSLSFLLSLFVFCSSFSFCLVPLCFVVFCSSFSFCQVSLCSLLFFSSFSFCLVSLYVSLFLFSLYFYVISFIFFSLSISTLSSVSFLLFVFSSFFSFFSFSLSLSHFYLSHILFTHTQESNPHNCIKSFKSLYKLIKAKKRKVYNSLLFVISEVFKSTFEYCNMHKSMFYNLFM